MEYEMVHEIQNLCPNNQMRDIFFDEVETDDPESYVRAYLKGRAENVHTDRFADGKVICLHALLIRAAGHIKKQEKRN